MYKKEVEHLHFTTKKNNSKWIKNLNTKATVVKFLEENIGENIYDINFTMTLWVWHQKHKEIKEKWINWNSYKIKSFCASRMWKDSPKNGKSIYKSYILLVNKGL